MTPLRLVLLAPFLPALALAQPTTAMSGPSNLGNVKGVVMKRPTEIDAKGFLGVIGQKITPHATLKQKSSGAPIPGKSLRFTIAGHPLASAATTDGSGEAKLLYQVPNDPPGSWPVEIRFAGDDEWLPSSATVTLGVFKASTKVTLKDPPSGLSEGQTLQIKGDLIRTSDGGKVDGRAITLTVDGKPAGKPATANGAFSHGYLLPSDAAPKVKVQAQFEGDVLYAASADSQDVLVKPPAPPVKKGRLVPQDAVGKRGETITLKALLLPENPMVTVNGGAGGVKVTFTAAVPGAGQDPPVDLCFTNTLPDGRASCTAKLDAPLKHYTLYAKACCTSGEWDVTDGVSGFDIHVAPVHLSVTGPGSARIGETINVKVRLTRTTDNKRLQGRQILLGGMSGPTDADGELTFPLSVSSQGGVGPRTYKARFQGAQDLYEPGEGTLTIQVSPKVN
jgi:hypothetical protein